MSDAIAVLNAGSSSLKFSLFAILLSPGIDENSAALRERVCRDARWLGVELDAAANATGGPRVSTGVSGASVWVKTPEMAPMLQGLRRTRMKL